jgi:hypothetical protein
MALAWTRIVVLVLALALGGCFAVTLHDSKLEETLPSSTSALVVGQSDRTQVRQALGEPLLTSDYWRFDAFRIKGWNAGVLFVGYIPIPGWSREEAYVLVSYAEDGRVLDVSYGQRIADVWSVVERDTEASAESGGLRLIAAGKDVYLAVSPTRRDEYLARPALGDRCRVLVGCVQSVCPASIVIDGAVVRNPAQDPATSGFGAVAVASLRPGPHRVEVLPVADKESFAAATEFACTAGETRHVMVSLEPYIKPSKFLWVSTRHQAAVAVSAEMPEPLQRCPLLLWGNGQWLVPQEPEQ